MDKVKKRGTLMARFAVMFAVFVAVTLVINGIITFINQTRSYHEEFEANLKNMTGYMNTLLAADGKDFANLKDYFIKHKDELSC